MRILAIDPGPTYSAYALFECDGVISWTGKCKSDELLGFIETVVEEKSVDHLAVEMIESFGMAVGREVFETCVWIGRFIEAWGGDYTYIYRKEVKMHLCGSMRAKDANIRQVILDRFGGKAAIGTKKAPGPLYGVAGDMWSAIAVGLTYLETKSDAPQRLN